MAAFVFSEAGLRKWVAGMMAKSVVYGPQARGERFVFDTLEAAGSLRLDYDVTLLPPRKFFQPPREVLAQFRRSTAEFVPAPPPEPFVLLGVHPYDYEAIRQLDKVFSAGSPDSHYLLRRRAATVVVCDPLRTGSDCFAGCMNTATAGGMEGWDLLLSPLAGERWMAEPRSAKGEALLALAGSPPVEASSADLAEREALWERNRQAARKHVLKMRPEEIPALLDRSYDHPVWAEKSALCYSCGSCNLVCPTCYCFTVEDELAWDMDHGQRTRRWDGCMVYRFAEVAGGHNFRERQAARYRHRYYRKGKYLWDRLGDIACVGCGRCITACTAKIANPVEVYNRLLEG